MSQRFNVSIPDDLARRMEPYKSQLSLSELMQDAIQRELDNLMRSDKDKTLEVQLKAAARDFWESERADLVRAVSGWIDTLMQAAANDRDPYLFLLYRAARDKNDDLISDDDVLDEILNGTGVVGVIFEEGEDVPPWLRRLITTGRGCWSRFVQYIYEQENKGTCFVTSPQVIEQLSQARGEESPPRLTDPGPIERRALCNALGYQYETVHLSFHEWGWGLIWNPKDFWEVCSSQLKKKLEKYLGEEGLSLLD